jgi:UDP-N-acetylmuramate dehydrogenase
MKKYNEFLMSLKEKDVNILFDESLSGHTSFHIGGKAKYFITVHNERTLKLILERMGGKFFIIGAGTNTLFRDKPFNGTIIRLGRDFNRIKIKKMSDDGTALIEVGAAVNLFTLNTFLKNNQLGGLEWSYGIPGSIGGATYINAGAFEKSIGDFIVSVKILENGRIYWIKDFSFGYRTSSFKNSNKIILAIRIKLNLSTYTDIERQQLEYIKRKKDTQPYGEYSAGSVFKRIIKSDETFYPAKIIDNLGLKGVRIGGAEVSTKHAGFIVNIGNARAKDVLRLIRHLKKRVKKATGEKLEEEIIIV